MTSAIDSGETGEATEVPRGETKKELKRKLKEAEAVSCFRTTRQTFAHDVQDTVSARKHSHTLKKQNKLLATENERLKQALVDAGNGPPSKRSKPNDPSEIVRRAGNMCTACIVIFPSPGLCAVFKSKLGSPQDGSDGDEDEDHTDEMLAVAAARRSAAAANTLPPEYNDPAFIETRAQQMIDALPAAAQKLKKKSWFAAEVGSYQSSTVDMLTGLNSIMEKEKPTQYAALMDDFNQTILPQYHAAKIVSVPALRPADLALRAAISAPSAPPPGEPAVLQ